MKHYLFCLRHFNDIDNITPAIYFFLERREVRVTILIYSLDYPYRDDRSLNFLLDTFPERVRVAWIGDFSDYPYRVTSNARLRLWHYRARRLAARGVPLERAITQAGGSPSLEQGIESLLADWGGIDQAVFDQNRTPVIRGLLDVLRNCGARRIVSLPVSPWVNINVLRQVDFIRTDAATFRKKHDYSGFDVIGQVDGYYAESLRRFFALLGEESPFEGKVSVLGAIRYCEEWLKIREGYMPVVDSLPGSGKPKILVLPSHPKNNSFWDEYLRTLEFVSQYERFEILVKPHTRYGAGYDKLPKNVRLVTEHDTAALIDWADMILYWGTSVALEGFQKGKRMVCLDYLNGNRSVFSLFGPGVMCRCKDDLMGVLLEYPQLAEELADDKEAAERLVNAVVFGGRGKDVPGHYLDSIEGAGHEG